MNVCGWNFEPVAVVAVFSVGVFMKDLCPPAHLPREKVKESRLGIDVIGEGIVVLTFVLTSLDAYCDVFGAQRGRCKDVRRTLPRANGTDYTHSSRASHARSLVVRAPHYWLFELRTGLFPFS